MQKQLLDLIRGYQYQTALLIAPSSFSSLRDYVLQLELQEEIHVLTSMLKSQHFAEEFKRRCALRMHDKERFFSFAETPGSSTNRLYYTIAMHFFQPQTMKELLEIITPNIKTQLHVSFSETLPQNVSHHELIEYIEEIDPIINVSDYNEDCKADFNKLSHYILVDDLLFDVQDIGHLLLPMHAKLLTSLQKMQPLLAQKLMSHNEFFKNLHFDIKRLQSAGLTPASVIKEISKELCLGSSIITGKDDANSLAQRAVHRFYEYFEELPVERKETLRALPTENSYNLGWFIDNHIKKGQCVMEASLELKSYLRINKNHPALNLPLYTAPEILKQLKKKYRRVHNETFVSQKSIEETYMLPKVLLRRALQQIQVQTLNDFCFLIINLPPNFYDLFWEHISVSQGKQFLKFLQVMLKQETLGTEQRIAMAKAVNKHYQRFFPQEPVIFWATEAEEPYLVEEALSAYPENQRFDMVTFMLRDGCLTSLYGSAQLPAICKTILKLLPPQQRLDILRKIYIEHGTLRYFSYSDFINVFQLIPEQHKKDWFNLINYKGNSLFHLAINHLQLLQVIVDYLPRKQRQPFLTQINDSGDTVLHWACIGKQHQSLDYLVHSLPKQERRRALEKVNHQGNTVLHVATASEECLQIVIKIHPKTQRLKLFKTTNNEGDTVLHLAAIQKYLFVLLDHLPEEEWFDALTTPNKKGQTPLHLYMPFSDFNLLLQRFSKEKLALILNKAEEYGKSLLYAAVRYPESLQPLLSLYPEQERLKRLTQSPLFIVDQGNPPSWGVILALLPEHQRLEFLKTNVNKGMIALQLYYLDQTETLKGSFAPQAIEIFCYLQEQIDSSLLKGYSRFFPALGTRQHAALLMHDLKKCDSFEDMKTHLLAFFTQYPDSPITRHLLHALVKENKDTATLDVLKVQWNVINTINSLN